MFYIHQFSCICHQPTFDEVDLENVRPSENNLVHAIEPQYKSVPLGQLRRMGRALRMGVGTGMHLLQQQSVNGILVGTANGGIEDSIMFLNQIMEYQEGRLTPTHFVQSTYNAIAGTMGMITRNKSYNATHVHRGQAFENTMLDAAMLLKENPANSYLIGGVDEISERNHRLVSLAGWYRHAPVLNTELYNTVAEGTLPGEGAAMFIVNNIKKNAVAKVTALRMVNSFDSDDVSKKFKSFIEEETIAGGKIDLFLHGENGDSRLLKFYESCETTFDEYTTIGRFKYMTGEFQTVSAVALWMSCYFIRQGNFPLHIIKKQGASTSLRRIAIYNNYQGAQHNMFIIEAV